MNCMESDLPQVTPRYFFFQEPPYWIYYINFDELPSLSRAHMIFYLNGHVFQGRSQPHSSGWARVPLSSFFLKSRSIFLIFPQTWLIFFLILALRMGESPTGKALAKPLMFFLLKNLSNL